LREDENMLKSIKAYGPMDRTNISSVSPLVLALFAVGLMVPGVRAQVSVSLPDVDA
jgi:hypothetical protein